ncbi:MAG: hypothetical protein OIF48_07615 [Silicimonas sp.]|nr:hypothetical protein [Silicimonas sp.]
MARKKTPTNLALDPEILARIDAWMKAQDAPWTKTAVFERALLEFLEKREGGDK